METGVYQIEFFDGSKWNLYFANSTQHKNTLRNIKENEHLIKSFELIVSGIHTSKQIEQVFNEIKNRKKTEKFARKDTKTGKGINEGFCFGDGEFYCLNQTDAERHAGRDGLARLVPRHAAGGSGHRPRCAGWCAAQGALLGSPRAHGGERSPARDAQHVARWVHRKLDDDEVGVADEPHLPGDRFDREVSLVRQHPLGRVDP